MNKIRNYGKASYSYFLEWKKYFRDKYRKTTKHILCPVTFSSENRAFYDKIWENMTKPDRTKIKDDMAHAHFMLDN